MKKRLDGKPDKRTTKPKTKVVIAVSVDKKLVSLLKKKKGSMSELVNTAIGLYLVEYNDDLPPFTLNIVR